MGYTTEFRGKMKLSKAPSKETAMFLFKLPETRRMKRDPVKIKEIFGQYPDCLKGDLGKEGMFFVGGTGSFGQDRDDSILDYNQPPADQPSLWCQWELVWDDNGWYLQWDGGEKFYSYIAWMKWILNHVLTPEGIYLEGEIKWQGEDIDDRGIIHATKEGITSEKLE